MKLGMSSEVINAANPLISNLVPEMQDKVRRIIVEMDGRGWQPKVIETLRTPEQQAAKVDAGVSKTQRSKHLNQGGRGAAAADIIDKRWGQTPEMDNPTNRRFRCELGDLGKSHGLVSGADWTDPPQSVGWDGNHIEMR